MAIQVCVEIVAVYDLDDIVSNDADADDIRLRLEIVRDLKASENPLSVRVWRKENYSVQPSFQQLPEDADDAFADEVLLVRDVFFEQALEGIHGNTPTAVLELALAGIDRVFQEDSEEIGVGP